MIISLVEYAKIHKRNAATVRRLAEIGRLKTAVKIGRNWVVDKDEDYPIIHKQPDNSCRYNNFSNEKATGVVTTPPDLATFVAEQMISAYDNTSNIFRILDPAIGDGILVNKLIDVIKSKYKHPTIHVVGFEINETIISKTYQNIINKHSDITLQIRATDFVSAEIDGEFNLIIANPPYIRTQILGSIRAQAIVNLLNLSGRVDIYYAFIILCHQNLSKNGVAGFITSNKYLTIKSGIAVRKYLQANTDIVHIIDFGDTKLFDAAVLPCVTIFKQKSEPFASKFTSIYELKNAKLSENYVDIFEALKNNTSVVCAVNNKFFGITVGHLETDESGSPWTMSTKDTNEWLARVEKNTVKRFSDIGKIRVGIKTTADNVFIKKAWEGDDTTPELLRPLITHRNAGQITSDDMRQWQVLYTHTCVDGKKQAIDINKFPKALAYLNRYRSQLEGRTYIEKANRNWYEIWVPQQPDSWQHKKIVFRDISETPLFWLDETGAVVNGDCYWIDIDNTVCEDDILLALAVANSNFIEKYYDIRFNNKLYSGKRRFMSQYVEQFPLPESTNKNAQKAISLVKKTICEGLSGAVKDDILSEIDCIVQTIFTL